MVSLARTLGIETSCDETSVAVLGRAGEIELNLLSSQIERHAPHGGVVPEIASREHLRVLPGMVREALTEAGGEIELLAVTNRPGLIGALLVGVRFAAALAWARSIPLVAVDHLAGHQASPFLRPGKAARESPSRTLALVASGGHSSWYLMTPDGSQQLGRTRDDAAGEAFDKVAKVLGLGYPGGPVVDRLARRGDASRVPLPRPRLKDSAVDFSFSGLKSAAIRSIRERGLEGRGEAKADQSVYDVLASFESAVVEHLLAPLPNLIEEHSPEVVTASGGVASNTLLRGRLREVAGLFSVEVLLPNKELTTDNAAMVARAGQLTFAHGYQDDPRCLDAVGRAAWQPPGMRRKAQASAGRAT
ncbi:MAG: tRNA (adenosine(37)-N6)-threonylcarbamoyltransferase complex transferase subunit TsaD [bacterium]|nr:tRNA (adenosine(37)-N6)-threonylcarbamoyltransferase complex transferase subunit TsaD [bacterium]